MSFFCGIVYILAKLCPCVRNVEFDLILFIGSWYILGCSAIAVGPSFGLKSLISAGMKEHLSCNLEQ